MFGIKNKKIRYSLANPFFYINVGYKEVYTRKCPLMIPNEDISSYVMVAKIEMIHIINAIVKYILCKSAQNETSAQ